MNQAMFGRWSGVAVVLTLVSVVMAQSASTQPATQPVRPNPNQGFLGARLVSVDEFIADERGLSVTQGVLIDEVIPESPAEQGGLQERDVIQKMDDTQITEVSDLQRVMATTRPGQEMRFVVIRGKEPVELTITLGKRPANMPTAPATRPG